MRKLKNIIILLLFAGVFWYFYGETFQQAGVQGVIEDIQSDVETITENQYVSNTINGIQLFIEDLAGNQNENPSTNNSTADQPSLGTPSEQTFSIHNIEIGDTRSDVKQQDVEPQRTTYNEYGVNWTTYHENYQNFFMTAYNENDQVVGLYTNQDLLASTNGISFDSTRDSVRSALDEEPLEAIQKGFVNYQINSEGEFDIFRIDNNYVTIFYDQHENNTVTAIQIIQEDLEQNKNNYFGDPSDELKEGFEYQLFDLTNAARVNHGLPVLEWEEPLRYTARDHSEDMAENNYFSHTNLDGQSPFDRMEEDNIAFQMAGENLAAGQTSSIFAHEGLMNSLGHRENILNADFEGLAVGVAFNSDSQPYYTEKFLTK